MPKSTTKISNRTPQYISIQLLASIGFFAAYRQFRHKDAAMAFALCMEAALYWKFVAPVALQKQKEDLRHSTSSHCKRTSSQDTPENGVDGKRKRQKTGVQAAYSQAIKQARQSDPVRTKSDTLGVVRSTEDPAWSAENGKKRTYSARAQQPSVFSPLDLQAGMAVLVRTEADDEGEWTKCWSLGRVTRINSARKTIDVVWLKPIGPHHSPPSQLFGQQWTPWTLGNGIVEQEWQSKGLSTLSIQYGTQFPPNGQFTPEEQQTLCTEVFRLENLVKKETREAKQEVQMGTVIEPPIRVQTLRKNSSNL